MEKYHLVDKISGNKKCCSAPLNALNERAEISSTFDALMLCSIYSVQYTKRRFIGVLAAVKTLSSY